MKDLKAQKGKFYIERLIEQGEHEEQDFKFSVNDARKIARSISAFANTHGGRLLIGVKDNGIVSGIRNEEDIYVVEEAASRYCRPEQHVDFRAYNVGGGVTVVQATIAKAVVRPVEVLEVDGRRVYRRVADENIVAHPLMVEAWRDTGTAITLGDEANTLLSVIEKIGCPVTATQAAVAAKLSMATTKKAIVSLLRLELVVFIYEHGGWYLTVPDIKNYADKLSNP